MASMQSCKKSSTFLRAGYQDSSFKTFFKTMWILANTNYTNNFILKSVSQFSWVALTSLVDYMETPENWEGRVSSTKWKLWNLNTLLHLKMKIKANDFQTRYNKNIKFIVIVAIVSLYCSQHLQSNLNLFTSMYYIQGV
jgi:hypothetical protein